MKNKLGSALLALIISFGLWLYVVIVVNPEWEQTFHDIPVVMDGEAILNDRGLMIVSVTNQTVDLTLEGNRSDLSQLNKTNITLLADLSQITIAGEHKLSYNISYPGNIQQTGTISVLEQTPNLITVVVAELQRKEIPVEISYGGAVPEGYIADKSNIKLDHTSVIITGPKDVLSQIHHAKVNVDLTGKNTTISGAYRFSLCDAEGNAVENTANITTNLTEIRITLKIQKTKEVPLEPNVIYGGGVTEQTSEILVNPGTILIAGSEAVLDSIDKITLGTIDLRDILVNTSKTYPIVMPEGVTNLTGTTDATVSISFPDLQIREFKVSNIVAEKLPAGLEATWITTILTVKLRGTTEVLDNLTAEDITIVVDLASAELGIQGYDAAIRVKTDGVVGALGTYQVYAEVQEKVDPGTEPQE